ncbi:hypothetical protein [Azotobacter vinelandii]
MECSCGGSMKSARAERSKHAAVLEFQECRSCGRCHFDALLIGGKLVAAGEDARRQFEAFDAPAPPDTGEQPSRSPGSTGREPATAPVILARKAELDWRPTSEQPPRDQLIRVDYLTGGYCVGHGWFFGDVWDLIARWAPCRSDEGLAPVPWPPTTPLVGTPFDIKIDPPKRPEIARPPAADLPPVGANFCFQF